MFAKINYMKIFSYLIILFFGCNSDQSVNKTTIKDSGETIHNNLKDTIARSNLEINAQCFQRIIKKDTATLKLLIADTIVTGELQYLPYEKDHNTGTIKGILKDSVIYADYTFKSEGVTSVREVIFKFTKNNLMEAYGNVQEQNGKIVFKDKKGLQYIPDPFVKRDCNKTR